jgi:hypothetical protein
MSLSLKRRNTILAEPPQPSQMINFYPEIIKILKLPQSNPFSNNVITAFNFGPYDNGYIVIGTSSGHLLTLEPKNLNRISSQKLFSGDNEQITSI